LSLVNTDVINMLIFRLFRQSFKNCKTVVLAV